MPISEQIDIKKLILKADSYYLLFYFGFGYTMDNYPKIRLKRSR